MYKGDHNMHKWDLTTIYPSFESAEFQGDLQTLKQQINQLNELPLGDDLQSGARSFIDSANQLMSNLHPLYSYTSLTHAVDTANSTALKYLDTMMSLQSQLTAPTVKFQKWLSSFSKEQIDGVNDDVLQAHRFFLHENRQNAQYLLSDAEEVLLSKLQTVGSSAWSQLQGKLTGDLQADFEIDGQTKPLTLSMLRNLAYHTDGDVRKRAYHAELAAYSAVDESVAAALNAIKGEVNMISALRGHQSPLAETVYQSRMDQQTLDAMIDAIKQKLPAFRKYLKRKAKLLGHSDGLPFYDLFAPVNDSSKQYSYEDAKAFVLKHFASFSDDLYQSAKESFDNNWLDVEPRKGKRGGAFCAHIVSRSQSRVMLNFDGSFSDVTTMAHELGHGYHNRQLFNETPLNNDYPMPLAETASIFCETIVTNAAAKEANKAQATYILEKSIEGSTQVVVDILSRFIFEKAVFEKRQEGPLTVDELKDIMLDAQRQSYGDGLDNNHLHPYMWACKPHYYSAGRSYYNFPYAFGLLFGLGLYAEYQNGRPNFVEDYNALLKNTTRMNVKDVAKTINIDISQKEFWLNSLSIIERQIEQFIELTQ